MKFYKEISLFPFFEIFNFPFSLEKDKRISDYIYIYIYIWNFTKKFLFFLSSKFLIFLSLFKKIKGEGGKKIDILPYLKYSERVDWYLPYFPHASFSSPPRQHRTANSLIRRRCSNNFACLKKGQRSFGSIVSPPLFLENHFPTVSSLCNDTTCNHQEDYDRFRVYFSTEKNIPISILSLSLSPRDHGSFDRNRNEVSVISNDEKNWRERERERGRRRPFSLASYSLRKQPSTPSPIERGGERLPFPSPRPVAAFYGEPIMNFFPFFSPSLLSPLYKSWFVTGSPSPTNSWTSLSSPS